MEHAEDPAAAPAAAPAAVPAAAPEPELVDCSNLSPELVAAIHAKVPEQIFVAAGKHYEAKLMGMMSSRPYSGGPLVGFIVRTGSHKILLDAFACHYFHPDQEAQTTEYFSVAHLSRLNVMTLNNSLAEMLEHARATREEAA